MTFIPTAASHLQNRKKYQTFEEETNSNFHPCKKTRPDCRRGLSVVRGAAMIVTLCGDHHWLPQGLKLHLCITRGLACYACLLLDESRRCDGRTNPL